MPQNLDESKLLTNSELRESTAVEATKRSQYLHGAAIDAAAGSSTRPPARNHEDAKIHEEHQEEIFVLSASSTERAYKKIFFVFFGFLFVSWWFRALVAEVLVEHGGDVVGTVGPAGAVDQLGGDVLERRV